MATNVIMPALGAAQETGKVLQWFKRAGDTITKGEPLLEIETDKAAAEIEAPATGTLANVTAQVGDVVPVGQVIGLILASGEAAPALASTPTSVSSSPAPEKVSASPVAARLAAEHNLDLSLVKPAGGRVEKVDVLAFIEAQEKNATAPRESSRVLASPKARRVAHERGIDLATTQGSGPDGAVLSADIPLSLMKGERQSPKSLIPETEWKGRSGVGGQGVGDVWRVMAERTTASWTSVPHFFLLRDVNASRLLAWREHLAKEITITDLLVKLVAAALRKHPRVNATWNAGTVKLMDEINVGIAVATEEGLVVPVIANADRLRVTEISARRKELVERAQANKLRVQDVRGGTFTVSNLGMYGVDAFNAIINAPQAALLAVGRIAERVVPLNHQPAVQPMLMLSLSCDHRVIDGVRGAQFLDSLAQLIEEPLALLD